MSRDNEIGDNMTLKSFSFAWKFFVFIIGLAALALKLVGVPVPFYPEINTWIAISFLVLLIGCIVQIIIISRKKKNCDCYIVSGEHDLYAELYEDSKSVVKGAKTILSATGSRSRDLEYLNTILKYLKRNKNIKHYRVLFGNPTNDVFKKHINELISLSQQEEIEAGKPQVTIIKLPILDGGSIAEHFVCASDSKAVIILPSFDGVGRYDTALVITDPDKAMRIARQIANYSIHGLAEQITSPIC